MPTVLLVEDNEMNRDMLSRRLRKRGWTVLEARNGQQAIDQAVAHLPEIVLMDLDLPVIDGWTAATRLKGLDITKHIPIIALTAHAMRGDRERALSAGCDDYEVKPFDFQRLLSKMEAMTP